MEFIDNVKNFVNHIYTDVMNYINEFLNNPESTYIIFVVLLVIAGFIWLFNEQK